MKKNRRNVMLRCDCGAETVVFSKYIFRREVDYEISIEDSYLGKRDYRGFFGRLKRAWHAFIDKPICFSSVYCENEEDMRKFLTECLVVLNLEEEYQDED